MSVRLFVRGQPVKLAPYLVYKSPDIAREIQVREYEGWSAGYCFGVYCDADCEYTNEGESEEHRLAKREIRQALLQVPGVTDVRLERYLREVRPDVSFVVNGQLVAIEIQLS